MSDMMGGVCGFMVVYTAVCNVKFACKGWNCFELVSCDEDGSKNGFIFSIFSAAMTPQTMFLVFFFVFVRVRFKV